MDARIPKIFKMLVTHGVVLEPEKRTYEFFGSSTLNEPSITELEEKDIVKWLISDNSARDLIIEDILPIKTGEKYFYKAEVQEPVLTKDEQDSIGDIDFLVCPLNNPELTTVIEFKRIKVITQPNGKVKINRFEKNRNKGLKQIRELRKFDFHQTYLGIIIEDDGRHTQEIGTVFKTSKGENVNDIFSITFDSRLDQYAGVIYIIVNQPTGENYNLRFNLKLCTHKAAKPIHQKSLMTHRVNTLIKENNNLSKIAIKRDSLNSLLHNREMSGILKQYKKNSAAK